MRNRQLKPGYNVQIGTEKQFVVSFSLHQKPSDGTCLIPHMEQMQNQTGRIPKNIIADAGYGSEENYQFLEQGEIQNYLKYNTYHLDKKKNSKKKPFHRDNFSYDSQKDYYVCPFGKRLIYKETIQKKTKTGFISTIRVYECDECFSCPYKTECTKSTNSRQIHYNPRLENYKEQARLNLDSEYGISLRKRRGFEVETFFGDLRQNCQFNRFLLRGFSKTEHEIGLLALGYNLRKLTTFKINKAA
jgi:hypothetical protein